MLPQAPRRRPPPLVDQTILQFEDTSLVSTLAVPDLLDQGRLITSATHRPLEVWSMVAALYVAVLLPSTQGARPLEARLARSAP